MSDSSSSSSSSSSPHPKSSSTSTSSATTMTTTSLNLRSSIKSAVEATNSVLSAAECAADDASSAALSRVRSIGRQARGVASKALAAYDARASYGPPLVAGSALALGGLAAMRRGRAPGAVAGLLGGAGAYAVVYGVPIYPPTKRD
uniref:Uncharacterized protein n=1 Tax=Odontella aurita TaxID=265563 RepID=A0A6U6EA80_9STRA|mmetsp:Transcript_25332/g.74546  ORF Transcript_25332/g.74546 Transcript_25332/m.74546 type:complete len:146 (+) Transcript_25332:317-754(+)